MIELNGPDEVTVATDLEKLRRIRNKHTCKYSTTIVMFKTVDEVNDKPKQYEALATLDGYTISRTAGGR